MKYVMMFIVSLVMLSGNAQADCRTPVRNSVCMTKNVMHNVACNVKHRWQCRGVSRCHDCKCCK